MDLTVTSMTPLQHCEAIPLIFLASFTPFQSHQSSFGPSNLLTHFVLPSMSVEEPFKISVTDDALALLKRKLDDTRLPDEVNGAGWDYGVPLADIRRLARSATKGKQLSTLLWPFRSNSSLMRSG